MAYDLTVYHSPDSDDAFMFYAITEGLVGDPELNVRSELKDIETLNAMALRGEVEVSAVSFHAYAYLSDRYHVLPQGASFGDGYGPRLIARGETSTESLRGKRVAVPGRMTSATLAFRMLGLGAEEVVVPFDRVGEAVASGSVDAGLLIHEGQLTYEREGFRLVLDLGEWWKAGTGLPLPLGGNVIRKDLPAFVIERFPPLMKRSIEFSMENRKAAIDFAKRYGRDLSDEETDTFVGMYVNDWTLDYGDRGREAVRTFLGEAFRLGLLPSRPEVSFI